MKNQQEKKKKLPLKSTILSQVHTKWELVF